MAKKVITFLLFSVTLFILISSCSKTTEGELPSIVTTTETSIVEKNEQESLTETETETKEKTSEIVTTSVKIPPTSKNITTTSKITTTNTITTTKETTTKEKEEFSILLFPQAEVEIETETTTGICYLYSEYEVPDIPDFKSWTNFRKSVNRKSGQWDMLNSDGTWTDSNGFRRKNDDYMVAMGSYYTHTLGDRFKITTDNGNTFTVTICDWKNDAHTDSKNQYSVGSGCIVEFYVDNGLCSAVRRSGSASSISELSGKITKIERI